MAVRAKFVCGKIERVQYPNGYITTKIHFRAVDKGPFWEATPSGTLEMECVNEEATKQFVPGQAYFLDFTPEE